MTRRLFALLLFLFTPAATADWPEFRGPTGEGHAETDDLPIQWSESQNVVWKIEVPGTGWSSPIVSDGRIYMTTAVPQDDESTHSLRTLCLDGTEGGLVWSKEVFVQRDNDYAQSHPKNSHASPTPIFEDGRLYVHFGPHGTAALDAATGEVLWETKLRYRPQHGNGGSPAIADDLLIICCDGIDEQFVVGLEKATGRERWRTPRDTNPQKGFSFCTPLIITAGGTQQAICPGSDAVFAYEPATGEEIWRVRYGDGYSVVPRPIYGNGLVYVCSGFGDGRLFAIDPTGRGDITDTHVRWQMRKAVPKTPSLVLADELLFVVDDGGIGTCLDATNGEIHWQKRIGGKFSASLLHAGDRVYFQDENGTCTVVRAAAEYEEIAKNQIADSGRTFASYAVIDDDLLIRTENELYRIGGR